MEFGLSLSWKGSLAKIVLCACAAFDRARSKKDYLVTSTDAAEIVEWTRVLLLAADSRKNERVSSLSHLCHIC